MKTILTFVVLVLLAAQGYCAEVSMIEYYVDGEKCWAVLCKPEGKDPFPTVVYNHGLIVDRQGYHGAMMRGYNLDRMCRTLAKDGFLAFAPLRKSGGGGNIPGHKVEVSRAIDYVKTRPDVDPSRIALMGFSRGGLLTLMVGIEREDLKCLLILAPAPGDGDFDQAVQKAPSLDTPVLLLVEDGDDPWILEDFDKLEQVLRTYEKEHQAIRYSRGGGHKLFWDVGYYWKDVKSFLNKKLLYD